MFSFEGSCWLCPGEQDEAIAMAIKGGSLTWDNTRKLPLKMGGFTDIYENLRRMCHGTRARRRTGIALIAMGYERIDSDCLEVAVQCLIEALPEGEERSKIEEDLAF